jgi:hypothetical protein
VLERTAISAGSPSICFDILDSLTWHTISAAVLLHPQPACRLLYIEAGSSHLCLSSPASLVPRPPRPKAICRRTEARRPLTRDSLSSSLTRRELSALTRCCCLSYSLYVFICARSFLRPWQPYIQHSRWSLQLYRSCSLLRETPAWLVTRSSV